MLRESATHDDSVSVKPSGPEEDDGAIRKSVRNSKKLALARCKKVFKVGTFNVRTIGKRKEHLKQELVFSFLESNLDILGIQEHRNVLDDPRTPSTTKIMGCHLILNSAWRNTMNASQGGTGLLISKRAYKSLINTVLFSPRIMIANFSGNPITTVINVYSPTEGDPAAVEFYDNLREAIDTVPQHNLLMVLGDFNARIGSDSELQTHCYYYHERTNVNGELLLETMEEKQLENTNLRFKKRDGKKWTFMSDMTLTKGQIDFVLVRKKWRNSILNTEAFSSFSNIGSDHRLVASKVRLSLRKKTIPKKTQPNWSVLRQDGNLQTKFTVAVKNRFSALSSDDPEIDIPDPTRSYGHFINAVRDTAKELLPKMESRKKADPTKDQRIADARDKVSKSYSSYRMEPNEDHRYQVKLAKDNLSKMYDVVQEEILEEKIARVENSHKRAKHKQSWNLINEVAGRTRAACAQIKGKDAEERVESWMVHFKNLLGQPPSVADEDEVIDRIHPDLNISTDPFTRRELASAVKQIKEGKAFGEDGLAPEIFKRCDFYDLLLSFYNNALQIGSRPDQWVETNIIPVPKKGDLSDPGNYRGIALSSITSKTLNRMILNRMRPHIETVLRINQNGFRQKRSTTSHILALRRIIEGVKEKNLPAVLLFVDFKKAFDSVHRGKLFKILAAYGVPQKIVELIKLMYKDTKARVVTPDGESDLFDILAGVLQGDTLAPFLFIIVVDYCMRVALGEDGHTLGFTLKTRQSRRHPAETVTDADFADDIALLSNMIIQAQELLSRLEDSAESVGLYMNSKKTKAIVYNQDTSTPLISKAGDAIEIVPDFVYLGAWVDSSERDIKIRKAKAWSACHKMKKIWNSTMSRIMKIRLFIATVESVYLYGSETWTLTLKTEKQLNGSYTRMLRMALGVKWSDKMPNVKLYGELPKLTDKIRERRLKLAGHCHRHPELVGHQLTLWDPQHGTRNQGRRKHTYIDTLLRDTGVDNVKELSSQMTDRVLWKKLSRIRMPSDPA